MTAEVIYKLPDDSLPEAEALERYLLAVLGRHDGLCLDNEPERAMLAVALAAACMDAIRDGTITASVIAGEPERLDDKLAPI